MEQSHNKVPFPGQKIGLIRVLLKRRGYEGSVQLSLDFNEDTTNLEIVPSPSRFKVKKSKDKTIFNTNNSEQLSFDLFAGELDS